MQEEVSALEDWAERWLELSVMPLFRCQQTYTPLHTSTAPHAGGGGAGSQGTGSVGVAAAGELPAVSVSSYLSSPKVAVFNQVGHAAGDVPCCGGRLTARVCASGLPLWQ